MKSVHEKAKIIKETNNTLSELKSVIDTACNGCTSTCGQCFVRELKRLHKKLEIHAYEMSALINKVEEGKDDKKNS